MKSPILIFVLVVLFELVFTPESFGQYDLWTMGTAQTVPEKKFEVGVFNPLRYGLTQKVEIASYLLGDIVLFPNVHTKIHWYTIPKYDILVATRHGINYPTFFLRFIGRKKPFGIDDLDPIPNPPKIFEARFADEFPTDLKIPPIIAFTNELLLSKMLIKKTSCTPPNLFLTLKLGIKNAIKLKESNMGIVTRPLIYHQQSIYHDTVLWYVGLDLEGHINGTLDFSTDIDFLSVGWKVDHFGIEHKGMVLWPFRENLTLLGGYKFGFGSYPDGRKFFIGPVIDIIYRFKIHRTEDGLMKNDLYERKQSLKDKILGND